MPARFDVSGVLQAAIRLGATAREVSQIKSRAVSTLRRRLPVVARRDIQTEYNLKAGRINAGLLSRPIESGVQITGLSRGIGLIEFAGRWPGRKSPGASAQVKKTGARQLYPGQFIATLLGGNRHIVSRTGAKREMTQGRYRGQMRQGLSVEYGPQIAQMLRRPERIDRLNEAATEILRAEIARLSGVR